MNDLIELGELRIEVTRKDIRNVHLSVHPPDGRVTMAAPAGTRLEVARAYAISKISWIRQQQATINAQAREQPRQYMKRESHHLWGRRYLLDIVPTDSRPHVTIDHKRICLHIRQESNKEKGRQCFMNGKRHCCTSLSGKSSQNGKRYWVSR